MYNYGGKKAFETAATVFFSLFPGLLSVFKVLCGNTFGTAFSLFAVHQLILLAQWLYVAPFRQNICREISAASFDEIEVYRNHVTRNKWRAETRSALGALSNDH